MRIIAISLCLSLLFYACTHEAAVPNPAKPGNFRYVYNFESEIDTQPVNMYFFYADKGFNVRTTKYVRVDFDDEKDNTASFILPKGLKAKHANNDSLDAELQPGCFIGNCYSNSVLCKGNLHNAKLKWYYNGKPVTVPQYEQDTTIKFEVAEYVNNKLRTSRICNLDVYKLK